MARLPLNNDINNNNNDSQYQYQQQPVNVHDQNDTDEIALKILVIGEAACGKTSIIHKYCLNKFEPKYKVTMGLDFFPKKVEIDNKNINLALWDVAGQERFHHMIRSYFKNANGAIIVFDLTRIYHTLNSASKWKLELDCCFPDASPIPCILLANKSDLFDMDDKEITKQFDDFIAENGIKHWFFTSAKEGFGLDEAMNYLTKVILENNKPNQPPEHMKGSFQIDSLDHHSNNGANSSDNNSNKPTKEKKCC